MHGGIPDVKFQKEIFRDDDFYRKGRISYFLLTLHGLHTVQRY